MSRKTLCLTELNPYNTSYPGDPEKFKKSADDKYHNALPIAECQAILAGSIVLD
jgi:hypothetical protein